MKTRRDKKGEKEKEINKEINHEIFSCGRPTSGSSKASRKCNKTTQRASRV